MCIRDRLRAQLVLAHPHLGRIDEVEAADPAALTTLAEKGGTPDKAAFVSPVDDFFLTNPIARASTILAECSALRLAGAAEAAE